MDYRARLAVALWVAAAIVDAWGLRLIVRGAGAAGHPQQSRWVIQGFRRLILGGGLLCFGFWLWTGNRALMWLGVFFLLEEAVETQAMTWAVKRQGKRE